jgi:hypothetical protein
MHGIAYIYKKFGGYRHFTQKKFGGYRHFTQKKFGGYRHFTQKKFGGYRHFALKKFGGRQNYSYFCIKYKTRWKTTKSILRERYTTPCSNGKPSATATQR